MHHFHHSYTPARIISVSEKPRNLFFCGFNIIRFIYSCFCIHGYICLCPRTGKDGWKHHAAELRSRKSFLVQV